RLGRRRPALGGQRLERRLRQRLDPVESGRDQAQDRDRVVVALVDRDPGEGTHVTRRPLREQRCLAVARGRHDQHEREGARRAQPVDERSPRDRSGQELGSARLRVGDLERQRWRARVTDEHGLRARPAQAGVPGITRCGDAYKLDQPGSPVVERYGGILSCPPWGRGIPSRKYAGSGRSWLSGDTPTGQATNTVQITTICTPGCTGSFLLIQSALAILLAGHVQLPQPRQAGRRKGFLSDRRSQRPPVGSCASFLGDSRLLPAARRRPSSLGCSGAPVIRVVLGEDSFLARERIARVLDSIEDVDLVAACSDLDELRTTVDEIRPDVVLTDIRMPPTNTDEGIRFAGELRHSLPEVGVVVLSQHAEPAYAMSLFENGSSQRAYLLKERVKGKDELERALREVADG